MDDLAMDIGQPILPALIAEGQASVVDATEMHQRGLHVVHVHRIAGNVPSKVVGRAVNGSRLYSATGQPPTEGATKMIAPIRRGGVALAKRRSTKFTTPEEHNHGYQTVDH